MARIVLATLTSFLFTLLFGPAAIRWLQQRFREPVRSDSTRLDEIQASKNQTPTMGGLLIISAIVIATLLWGDLLNHYIQIGLVVALAFAGLGAWDDWTKLKTSRNGLSVKQKLLVQVGIALSVAVLLYLAERQHSTEASLFWPFGGHRIPLGIGLVVWAAFVTVSVSNAVNLTDGLDGLASGCMICVATTFVGLTFIAGNQFFANRLTVPYVSGGGEVAVLMSSMLGGLLGFLWFNCHPAQVFMGDTGSLSIGSLLAFAAVVARQEVLLVICGGVFVVEAMSVILQVGCYKLTGQRIILCSPLHNHYLFRGDPETRIVIRFWIASAVLVVVGIGTLLIR
ncbi:phospho-N-acetylmuramoyl-pentapeptide-transferase [Thalassoroseus pseudoceratinae]|uniref:phospho-N-acetylmuramoyl-pentapeptide- transferase n=1 Tax=Thalassoroseus pseudoceratinae TaxID=2713176 RepID=UPI001F107019|nr:phospho-N-acetylmuramoyl-pentapeptide-transferase [Thalassoroseus pseudoceratinae]